MAERSQYQYTQIVGPVWNEPVASRLAWLPSFQYPGRLLPPNRLGDFVQPAFDALYKPAGIQWAPSDRYAGRSLAYSPTPYYARPEFAALYAPERLEWKIEDRYYGRSLLYPLVGLSIFQGEPIVPAAAPAVVPAGGDSARIGLARRRPLYYWEAAALKRLSQREVETSLVEELAYAEATIPKSLDDFEERVSHLREIAKRLDAVRAFTDLAKRVRSVIERFEETRIKQLADQDEENEINDLIQFL